MATKILVSRRRTGKAEEWTEVDVNETTLMFFDVFLASINSTWATTCESDGENDEECDHFECEKELFYPQVSATSKKNLSKLFAVFKFLKN